MNRKILFTTTAVFIFIFMAHPALCSSNYYYDVSSDSVPQPRLLAPVTSEVDLTGKDELEFKWSPHEGDIARRKYYDFRLYKGTQMYEKNLIIKEQVPPNKHSFTVRADIFEDGQLYVWSVRQKYLTKKGRRSDWTFKIIRAK